ncbi:hypothetical protein PTE_00739 [Photorhabdus khanii NC19]|uniref:Uncharacterized protein n=1 Tax=Photorhabdus khanii NC19 TaxID=1004151 RepID=W3VCD5_9GAMM|nr:hypothetical protein PTE_00739 [Photorhabdus khanii NC19]
MAFNNSLKPAHHKIRDGIPLCVYSTIFNLFISDSTLCLFYI